MSRRIEIKRRIGEMLGTAVIANIAMFNLNVLTQNFQIALPPPNAPQTRLLSNSVAGAAYLVAFVILNPFSVALFNPITALGAYCVPSMHERDLRYRFADVLWDTLAHFLGAFVGVIFARILMNDWYSDPLTAQYTNMVDDEGRLTFFNVSLIGSFFIVLLTMRIGKSASKGLGPLLVPIAYSVASLIGPNAIFCTFNPAINFAFICTRNSRDFGAANSAGQIFNQWAGQLAGLLLAIIAWRVTTTEALTIFPPFKRDDDKPALSQQVLDEGEQRSSGSETGRV